MNRLPCPKAMRLPEVLEAMRSGAFLASSDHSTAAILRDGHTGAAIGYAPAATVLALKRRGILDYGSPGHPQRITLRRKEQEKR